MLPHLDSDKDAPDWFVLPKHGRKEGPFSLTELCLAQPSTSGKVRRDGDETWIAWDNVHAMYPELKVVHLRTGLDRTTLLPARLIEVLLNPETRQQLLAEMRHEIGTTLPLQNWIHDLAPVCQATPQQLRDAVQGLIRDDGLEMLASLLGHPDMPEDVLLEFAGRGEFLSAHGHRPGPRALLEKLADEHGYSEAIVTLALDYYGADSASVEEFARFVARHQNDLMLRRTLRQSPRLPEAKMRRALEIVGNADADHETGFTAAHRAAHDGNLAGLRIALESGAAPNARDPGGWTPLHWIASMGVVHPQSPDIVDTLISAGANVNARARDGRTPLHVACSSGAAELVEKLVQAGASVHVRDAEGATPLIEAARSENRRALECLKQAGSVLQARDKSGRTARDWASANGSEEIANLLPAPQIAVKEF